VESVDYPELMLKPGPGMPPDNENRKCPHGVILKIVTSNICGSDQHMVSRRTTAPVGMILGHRHADLDVTMRIYVHTNLDTMRQALDKIDWDAQ
jgi:hypothetical protein